MQGKAVGLKCGTVSLVNPDECREEWDRAVEQAVQELRSILRDAVVCIEEVGSGSIHTDQVDVLCKPIVDLAVAVENLDDAEACIPALEKKGYMHHGSRDSEQQIFFVKKNADGEGTHHIYIVKYRSDAWNSLRNFREYLALNTEKLKKYSSLKQELAAKYYNDRHSYNRCKAKFVQNVALEANDYFVLNQTITVTITNPIGAEYPVNYGYNQTLFEETGRKQWVYVLGVDGPREEFTGKVIAMVKHENTADKLVVAPEGVILYEPDIAEALSFKEGNASATYRCSYEKSCGAVLFLEEEGVRNYLLIKNRSLHAGFPKGHVEYGETELETVRREIFEETGLHVDIVEGFRHAYDYKVKFFIQKTAVYLLAQFHDRNIVPQEGEVLDYWIVPVDEAMRLLEFEQDRNILRSAEEYLNSLKK